jgi:hypothetical protein
MARFCGACGRPLDKRGHRILRRVKPLKLRGQVLKRPRTRDRGRGRVGIQMERVYLCRVIPAYDSPTSGKTLARGPYDQRIARANIRHVQEDRVA